MHSTYKPRCPSTVIDNHVYIDPSDNRQSTHLQTVMKKLTLFTLLSIAIVSSLLATSCSTARGTTKQGRSGGYVQIEPRQYNSETRGFDRPWPFGPESNVQ
jgi:hypothetical protein